MRIQSLRDYHLFFPDLDGFWDPLNLAETESRIRMALPNSKEVTGPLHVAAVTQAVRLFSLQNKMPQAKEFLRYAEHFLLDLDPEEKTKLQVRFFLEEGRFFNLSMNPVRALESFRKAWLLSQDVKKLDYLAIDAAFMISVTLQAKQGKDWFNVAFGMAEGSELSSPAAKWKSYLFAEAGWKAFDSKEYGAALTFFEKAAVASEINNYFSRTVKWSIARVKRALGDIDEALALQNNLLFEMTDKLEPNAFIYLEIAECYQAKHELSKAAPNFQRAYEGLQNNEWYSENYVNELKDILKKSKFKKYH